eukprot:GILI01020970.1.p3 GENE.GILI01020970.1~~GILI01020970.1.p3  ORF type:complete len:108 (-),score=20.46 GILI01020970.1:126-449(-)
MDPSDRNEQALHQFDRAGGPMWSAQILRLLFEGEPSPSKEGDNAGGTVKKWSSNGLWAPLLLSSSKASVHKAKLLFSAMCCTNNTTVIDYLLEAVDITFLVTMDSTT